MLIARWPWYRTDRPRPDIHAFVCSIIVHVIMCTYMYVCICPPVKSSSRNC